MRRRRRRKRKRKRKGGGMGEDGAKRAYEYTRSRRMVGQGLR
jgi:hypothetical protein